MAGKKSALTEAQVDEIEAKYNCGFGTTIPALARAYDVAPASVRYRLNQRGVLNTGVTFVKPETAEQAPKAELDLSSPAIQAALDDAIAARIEQMMGQMADAAPAPVAAPVPTAPVDPTSNLATLMTRMFEVISMQQPGYQKPMPPDEMEQRLAGKVEMEALLARHKSDYNVNPVTAVLPKWRVGEKGFFECSDAVELSQGDVFVTYLPPVEDFEPLNPEAEKVKAAQMKWLGGPTLDIGEQVRNAEAASRDRVIIPGAMAGAIPKGPIQIVERAADSATPAPQKRQFGTAVPEPKNVVGGASEPIGPAYEAA